MAVKHLSYLDLTPEQRAEGARKGRQRIQGMLMSPFITGDQAVILRKQLERLDQWERGAIEGHPQPTPQPTPQAHPPTQPSPSPASGKAHSVSVGESIKVHEKAQ